MKCACGKYLYVDKRSVQTFLNQFARTKRGRHGRPEQLRAYPCPEQKGWHVTKRV